MVNHTHSDPLVSFKTSLTLDYVSDIERACEILLAAALSQARVHKSPEPTALIKQLGENGVELELTVWIHDPDQGQAGLRSDILQYVLRHFREANISMPAPPLNYHRESSPIVKKEQ